MDTWGIERSEPAGRMSLEERPWDAWQEGRLPFALEKSRCHLEGAFMEFFEALYQKRKQAAFLDGNAG